MRRSSTSGSGGGHGLHDEQVARRSDAHGKARPIEIDRCVGLIAWHEGLRGVVQQVVAKVEVRTLGSDRTGDLVDDHFRLKAPSRSRVARAVEYASAIAAPPTRNIDTLSSRRSASVATRSSSSRIWASNRPGKSSDVAISGVHERGSADEDAPIRRRSRCLGHRETVERLVRHDEEPSPEESFRHDRPWRGAHPGAMRGVFGDPGQQRIPVCRARRRGDAETRTATSPCSASMRRTGPVDTPRSHRRHGPVCQPVVCATSPPFRKGISTCISRPACARRRWPILPPDMTW